MSRARFPAAQAPGYLLALLLAAGGAQADTVCRLVSTPGANFGNYDTLASSPVDTLTHIRVTCDRDGGPARVTITMRLGPGVNGSSASARRMRQMGGDDYLSYGLYRDVSRSSVWGESSVDAVVQTIDVPNRSSRSAIFTIYGRIPALQDVSAGSYSDRIGISLTP